MERSTWVPDEDGVLRRGPQGPLSEAGLEHCPEHRFETLTARPRRTAARFSATVVSLAGHAALLALALFVLRPSAAPPAPPAEREVLIVRAPRLPAVKPAVLAPSITNPLPNPPTAPASPVVAPTPQPPPPAPVAATPPAVEPPAPPAPAPKQAPAKPRLAARAPRSPPSDAEQPPLPPQTTARAKELLQAAQEAALREAAQHASAHPAAETHAVRASAAEPSSQEPGPTPAEEKRFFTQTLAERVRAHWVLPAAAEGGPRSSVLVALTVRLLGAGYRLDCRPDPSAVGDTAQKACAAIAAADLPQLPQSLARDGMVLAARFVP